ncbi:unnamed protein product, partial [Agarophyton chilense]
MRTYLRQKCNLENSAHIRRVLRPLSVRTLCTLLADAPPQLTRQFRQLVALLPQSLRHPHELLLAPSLRSDWQRCATQAYKLRERREAEFHLAHFVAHQLRLPLARLRAASAVERHARELQAFQRRMRAFDAHVVQDPLLHSQHTHHNSAPSSPAHSVSTSSSSRRHSLTDPIQQFGGTPLAAADMRLLQLPGAISAEPRKAPPPPPRASIPA